MFDGDFSSSFSRWKSLIRCGTWCDIFNILSLLNVNEISVHNKDDNIGQMEEETHKMPLLTELGPLELNAVLQRLGCKHLKLI